MHRLLPFLALLIVTPALAESLDCAVIKSTTHSFELTLDWTRTEKGKDPLASYALTKIVQSSDGSVRGIAGGNRAESWYSRDLKTALYTRYEEDDGSIVEQRARAISTTFTPVE
jgi:hypothetical protein